MKFAKEEMLMITNQEEPNDDFEVIEVGDWINDHKYDWRDIVFRYKDKFYQISEGRSGSYFSEYYYDSEDWSDMVDVDEVEKVQVTRYEWRRV